MSPASGKSLLIWAQFIIANPYLPMPEPTQNRIYRMLKRVTGLKGV
jgi:hypothetical protein